jgi:hypothetical protein
MTPMHFFPNQARRFSIPLLPRADTPGVALRQQMLRDTPKSPDVALTARLSRFSRMNRYAVTWGLLREDDRRFLKFPSHP